MKDRKFDRQLDRKMIERELEVEQTESDAKMR